MRTASDGQKNVIGTYEIEHELGRGGMGVVFRAFEPALSRHVALKMLSESIAHQPDLVARFYREARAMAAISDPNVVQIHSVGEHAGKPYFVMEMIDGESLGARLKRERLSVSQAIEFLRQAALGLQAAHERNLVHRDIKPANLMITKRGVVKLMDFGIALTDESQGERLTGTGGIVGTPGYLSPEVCLGQTPDVRTDIFALGVVFFEMLTGRLPFDEKSPYALMVAVVQAQIPDVTLLNSNIDPDTLSVLKKMLERDPNHRFQSCDALLAALDNKTRPQITPLPPTELTTPPPILAPLLSSANPQFAAQPPIPPPCPQNQTVVSTPHPQSEAWPVKLRMWLPWGIGLAACAVVAYFVATSPATVDERTAGRPGQIETQRVAPANRGNSATPSIGSAGENPVDDTGALPALPADVTEQTSGQKSIYMGNNAPNAQPAGAASGTEITRELLGKYVAKTKSGEQASFVIDSLGKGIGDEVSGYLLLNNERIKLRGNVIDLQIEEDTDGDSWRVYSANLSNSDGAELAASVKHTDKHIGGTLLFKPSNDADVINFAVEDFSSN